VDSEYLTFTGEARKLNNPLWPTERPYMGKKREVASRKIPPILKN